MKRSNKVRYYNRHIRGVSITSMTEEIMAEISKFYPIQAIRIKKENATKSYHFSLNSELTKQLTKYGLEGKNSGTKFIPKEALYSDIEYRQKLLAGLIDTDGYFSRACSYSICTKSRQLAEDYLWLVRSLGGRGRIFNIKKTIKKINFEGDYYNVQLYLGKLIYGVPIKNRKKIRKQTPFWSKAPNRRPFRIQQNIGERVYGFTVDSPSHWYITDNFMVTCNSGKSLSMLAVACKLKDLVGQELTEDDIAFTPTQLLQKLRIAKKHGVILFDEAGTKAYGVGSGRESGDITTLIDIIRMKQISVLFASPHIRVSAPLHFKFQAVSRFDTEKGYAQHLVWDAGPDPAGLLGYVITKMPPKKIVDWYRKIKWENIERAQTGETLSDRYLEMQKIAAQLLKNEDFLKLNTSKKKAVLASIVPGRTSDEYSNLMAYIDILKSKLGHLLDKKTYNL